MLLSWPTLSIKYNFNKDISCQFRGLVLVKTTRANWCCVRAFVKKGKVILIGQSFCPYHRSTDIYLHGEIPIG